MAITLNDEHIVTAFEAMAGTGASTMNFPTLTSAVDNDMKWSADDVQAMFDAADQDNDGLIHASDVGRIVATPIPAISTSFSLGPIEPTLKCQLLPLTHQRIGKLKAM